MTLEEEINQAYGLLAKTRQKMDAINRMDTRGFETSMLRIEHEHFLDLKQQAAAAELEIERLRMVLAARTIDPFFDQGTGEEKFLLVARSWLVAKLFAQENGMGRWRYAGSPALLLGIAGYHVIWIKGCETNPRFAEIRMAIEMSFPVHLTGEPYQAG
jgi:hypothetical protein